MTHEVAFIVRTRNTTRTFPVTSAPYARSAAHEAASDCASNYAYAELWRVEGDTEVLLAKFKPFVMPEKMRRVA